MADREAHWRHLEKDYASSPIHRMLGLELAISGKGRAAVRFTGAEEVGNRHGTVAGGIIAVLIDSAAVQACRSALPEGTSAVTVEMKANFVRSAGTGRSLRAEGTVEHVGGSLGVGHARVFDEESRELVAVGLVTVRVKRPG